MLFNSYVFIFGFLPVCLIGFYAVVRVNRAWARIFLTFASFVFYGWWNVQYVPLLAGSIVFNYLVGRQIQGAIADGHPRSGKLLRTLGVFANIGLLGYFKYSNFLIDNSNMVFGTDFVLSHVVLPLGISFFTFQKIAYLVDSARGQIKRSDFVGFSLFAVFFPQLISGPIVRYDEVYPQFYARRFVPTEMHLLIGAVIFAVGLFKKTVIADTAGTIATPLYEAAARGTEFGLLSGWIAAASYTVQVYFDFSGYSDMAIGLARMFGVLLPLNFHSPLRAPSIIDYWRRWHMTLTRFMLSYVYNPLSLYFTRHGMQWGLDRWPMFFVSVAVPAFLTFLTVGIWHGAGWTFVLYGVIHATYVCGNEAWREFQKQRRKRRKLPSNGRAGAVTLGLYHALTVLCVVTSNVMFRANDVSSAGVIYRGMFSVQGVDAAIRGVEVPIVLFFIILSAALIAFMPNTQQIMSRYRPAVNWRQWHDVAPSVVSWKWRPDLLGVIVAGGVLFMGLMFIQRGEAAFLYFNF